MENTKSNGSKRDQLFSIIFHADTKAGRMFDVILLISIVLSVLIVMLDSVMELHMRFTKYFFYCEWIFTLVFTGEYITRIVVSRKPMKYVRSFYGVIDLLSIVPTYLSLVLAGSHYLLVIRILRMLRIFRVLKLTRFLSASQVLQKSLQQSKYKIVVFLEVVITVVVIMGSLMYLLEGPENGFNSIPKSIYWAIVTLTTVGYGDISPATPLGQFLASIVMIMGYAIIAVPTGIVTAEIIKPSIRKNTQVCPECLHDSHEDDAVFCKKCGSKINI